MRQLEKSQNEFFQSLINKDYGTLDFISSPNAVDRFNIYLQNMVGNLSNCLEITYPGIWKLIGNECANGVAKAFLCDVKNLPSSGCLDDWGADFPKFLTTIPVLQSLTYLEDYARYEWLIHLSYFANSVKKVFNPQELISIPEQNIESIKLTFLPSLYLFTSKYPIDKIKEVITNSDAEEINLKEHNIYALIVRPQIEVLTLWINEDLWVFIESLQQRLTLGQALEKVVKKHPSFDLTKNMGLLLKHQLIYKINYRG